MGSTKRASNSSAARVQARERLDTRGRWRTGDEVERETDPFFELSQLPVKRHRVTGTGTVLYRYRFWMAAVARGPALFQTIASRSTVVACCTTKNGSPSVRVATGLRLRWPLAVGGRLNTGHLSFVRSTWQRLPRSMPGQRPVTDGRGPPPQSEHRRQSISSPRRSLLPSRLRFAAWSSAVPLAGVSSRG